jgi:RND family efflux transporter MFP subunit
MTPDIPPLSTHPATPAAMPPSQQPPAPARRGWLWLSIVGIGLAGLFLTGYLPRLHQQHALENASRAEAGHLRVRVANPRPAPATIDLHLSGSVEAWRETTIYARSNGYVRNWSADLGDSVTEGQVLVDLDAPEMAHVLAEGEANLARARADLERVKADLALAQSQLQRAKTLGPTVTSQQDIDTRQSLNDVQQANLLANEAIVRAEEANLRRLQQLKAFSKVLAPFAGTVTYRGIDVGELVTSGSGSTTKVLYRIAQTDQLRVLIDVPQNAATAITQGLAALVHPRSGVSVEGSVSHLARALDPTSRTMRAEIVVQNRDGVLLPGMYVQTTLKIPNRQPLLLLNSNALLNGAKGTQIAVVGTDGVTHLRTIRIDLDTGSEIGLASGVTEQEQVMLNPPAGLADGTIVEVLPPEPTKPAAH